MSDETITSVDFDRKPPPRKRFDWEAIAYQLRQHPGEWALVFENGKTSIANAVRQGSINALDPNEGYEVMTSNNTRGPVRTCSMWLRYNPDGSD